LASDNFSARWTGSFVPPADGQYVFQTRSDDGVRLWINNSLVIDNWTAHSPTINASSPILLGGGQRYDVKLEYQELGGGAVIELEWRPPAAVAFSALPSDRLYAN
jgi:MSHA biogenesis protein MshQ